MFVSFRLLALPSRTREAGRRSKAVPKAAAREACHPDDARLFLNIRRGKGNANRYVPFAAGE